MNTCCCCCCFLPALILIFYLISLFNIFSQILYFLWLAAKVFIFGFLLYLIAYAALNIMEIYYEIYTHLINLKNTSQIKDYGQAALNIIYFTLGLFLLALALYFAYSYLDDYWFLKYPLLVSIILIFAILITYPSNLRQTDHRRYYLGDLMINGIPLIKGSFAIIIFYFMLTEPYLPQAAQFCYDYLYPKYIKI